MKNSLYTYGFLGAMLVSLVTLATLQYKWLGSVSDAEKERLEESLSASSENFVSDFNDVFSELSQTFRVQISNQNEDIKSALGTSYLNWIDNSGYPELLDSVYVVKKIEQESIQVLAFSTDPLSLTPIPPTRNIKKWVANKETTTSLEGGRNTLQTSPDLGNPSFLEIPIQFLDMVQVSNQEFGKKIEVQLSLDQLDDIILLKLDDQFIKDEIIPDIAKTYFSGSFEDQYTLSLVKNSGKQDIYFTTSESNMLPDPDFSTPLDRFRFDNIMVFKSNPGQFSVDNLLSDSIKLGFRELTFESQEMVGSLNVEANSSASISHFYTRNISSSVEDSKSWQVQTDTTISSSLNSSVIGSPWQLWLSFKEGSLDAFVNKTRNRNLGISFGILSILGISVVLIVVFSQRSRELAEQQMLFVAGVSHELRTPITVIRSAAENLTEGVIQDEKRKKQYADLMLNEGRRLSDMVDQIMEFSGIQSGKRVYHFRSIELAEMLESIKEESKHLLNEKGMHLEYSIDTKQKAINGDADAIFLCVINLINNAVKFSGECKKILLKIDEVKLKGDSALRIQVQDYGIGIPEKEQSLIFKPFFRGKKPVNDQVKGNGIGLSLVQKVALAHNGDLTVKSKEGKGSIFSLILPLKGSHD
ncbi:MAG: HAMP domain-containing sensor histidine kinase [Balneolaceae bacterium]